MGQWVNVKVIIMISSLDVSEFESENPVASAADQARKQNNAVKEVRSLGQ